MKELNVEKGKCILVAETNLTVRYEQQLSVCYRRTKCIKLWLDLSGPSSKPPFYRQQYMVYNDK